MSVADTRPLPPEAVAARKRRRRRRGRSRPMSLVLHGSLILACLVAVFPVLWILISSFKDQEEILGSTTLSILPHHWQISNYVHVLTDDDYVFLEINPNGQWGWIQSRTGLPIAEALADLLAGARPAEL